MGPRQTHSSLVPFPLIPPYPTFGAEWSEASHPGKAEAPGRTISRRERKRRGVERNRPAGGPPHPTCSVLSPSQATPCTMHLCRVTRPAQGPSRKPASQGWLGCLSFHVPLTQPFSSASCPKPGSKSNAILPAASSGWERPVTLRGKSGARPQAGRCPWSQDCLSAPQCLAFPPAAARPACSCIICTGCPDFPGSLEHAAHSHSGETPQDEVSEGGLCPEGLFLAEGARPWRTSPCPSS